MANWKKLSALIEYFLSADRPNLSNLKKMLTSCSTPLTTADREKSRARKIFSVPVAEFFWLDPGATFLVAFSFILVATVRQEVPRLKKLGAKNKNEAYLLRAAFAHTRTQTSSMT